MNLAILPAKQSPLSPYKHFTVESQPAQEAMPDGKMEFFYIGKNSVKIDYLIKSFECGYAAETLDNATAILKRISKKHNPPDIFIIDASFGPEVLKEFHRFISNDPNYSLIPLILDASGLNENEIRTYRNFKYLDEIIFLEDKNAEKLLAKVAFLKRIKKQRYLNLIRSKIQTSNFDWNYRYVSKRAFDVIISLLAILILSPLLLIIAIAIKIESRGPVLYVSQRAGSGYRVFDFYKFRTMILDADTKVDQLSHLNQYNAYSHKGPVFFKITNDPRITRVGAFLRNTSLDELPQLFNVFTGDMSLVGNRPLPLYEAAALTTDEWAGRFMAPAGMTGLWQIKKRGGEDMTVEERIQLDIAYAQKYNFMYDLWIMANTPSALIQKSNT